MSLQNEMASFRRTQEALEAVRAKPHTRQEVIWEMRISAVTYVTIR